MLAITILMLNKEKVTARELADKFEVSIRTIYRDLEAINLAGIPLVSYPGNNGGYGILKNFKLDRQILTLNDMISILSALKGINTSLEDNSLDSAINKISSLIPSDKKEEVDQYTEQISFDLLPWGYRKKEKEIMQLIHNSIINTRIIEFKYKNNKGENYTRIVEPMTLVYKANAWYLFSYCLKKNDFRFFRLSKINNIKIKDQTFIRKKASYRDYLIPDLNNMTLVDLKLRFSPTIKDVIEDFFEEDNISYDNEGYIIVDISFPEGEWIISTILSYGDNVEVLKPEYLKKIIKEKAKKIMEIYNT